jgi:hypothetical protein
LNIGLHEYPESSSGGGTGGMDTACTSWPDSSIWNERDMVRITPAPSWLATTLRVQNERPSRERATSKWIGWSASPGRMK